MSVVRFTAASNSVGERVVVGDFVVDGASRNVFLAGNTTNTADFQLTVNGFASFNNQLSALSKYGYIVVEG